MAETLGPEKFAPPDRRPLEKHSGTDQVTTNIVEGDIGELARRDVSFLHPRRSEVAAAKDAALENLDELIRRIAGGSMDEIGRVIRDLEGMHDMIRREGERVSREIVDYASLGHSATTVMNVIAGSIKQWKDASDRPGGSLR
jgi:hypothetical protein